MTKYPHLYYSPKRNKKISLSHKKLWENEEYAKNHFKAMQLKPTLPEKQINEICQLNNIPFEYTGDEKVMISRHNPDFVSNNKKIIEFNGEYWHKNKNREKRKKRIYNSLGYELLVIWGTNKLKNPQKVTEKIINFYCS
jgi:very-short-patch-repair endonuclease